MTTTVNGITVIKLNTLWRVETGQCYWSEVATFTEYSKAVEYAKYLKKQNYPVRVIEILKKEDNVKS